MPGKTTALMFLNISLRVYCPSLVNQGFERPYLVLNFWSGHTNEYVRSSTARAIAGALEQHPQTIVSTLSTLEDYYREKVYNVSFFLADDCSQILGQTIGSRV